MFIIRGGSISFLLYICRAHKMSNMKKSLVKLKNDINQSYQQKEGVDERENCSIDSVACGSWICW